MTINNARAIVEFVCKLKKEGMRNEDVVWELANNFNVEEESDKLVKRRKAFKENVNDL